MSTSNFGGAQSLTQDEQILHHYAAMIKKGLDAYHAESRSKRYWKGIFKHHLVRSILANHFYKPFSDSSR